MNEFEKGLINKEIKGCFDFFWNESNTKVDNVCYGLTLDRTDKLVSSIASVGFGLCAYVIGVEHQFITYDEGYERVLKTLKTIEKIEKHQGFLPHFIDIKTGKNARSEFSTIDSAILFMGAIASSEYFKGETKQIVEKLLEDANWDYFIFENKGKLQVNMGYSNYYWHENNNFCPAFWDHYAEQLMIYFLYAGKETTTKEKALKLYQDFERNIDTYNGKSVIHCYSNALFIHQFTHLFLDLKNYIDKDGVDWFENSINATLCNKEYCQSQTWSKTYHENSWGLSAFLGKYGYKVYGAPPFGFENLEYKQEIDGSVTPYAALSSMMLTPKESIEALKYFNTIDGLNKKYGLTDCYNFDDYFISNDYLGIDKGPTIIALDNYLNQTIWKYVMQNKYIKQALIKLDFKRKE